MRTSFATISRQGARSNNEDYLLVMDRPEAKRLTGIYVTGWAVIPVAKWPV